MPIWGSVLVVLIVPVAWGLVSAWFFDWLRLRKQRRAVGHGAGKSGGSASS